MFSKYSAISQTCDHWLLEKVNRHLCDVRAALARPSPSENSQNKALHVNKLSPYSSVTDLIVWKNCELPALKIAPCLAVNREHISE